MQGRQVGTEHDDAVVDVEVDAVAEPGVLVAGQAVDAHGVGQSSSVAASRNGASSGTKRNTSRVTPPVRELTRSSTNTPNGSARKLIGTSTAVALDADGQVERHDEQVWVRLADDLDVDDDANNRPRRVARRRDVAAADPGDARLVRQALEHVQLDQCPRALDVGLADQLVVPRPVLGMPERRQLALVRLEPVDEELVGCGHAADDVDVDRPDGPCRQRRGEIGVLPPPRLAPDRRGRDRVRAAPGAGRPPRR